ncbi:MAG: hypothetical protein GY765_12415 [bacterium]|nr:hypothetical protein [bacterium]
MKHFEKKLNLEKVTIDDLFDNHMAKVLGGVRTVNGNKCITGGCGTRDIRICDITLTCNDITQGGSY